jgi:hypothetical protein
VWRVAYATPGAPPGQLAYGAREPRPAQRGARALASRWQKGGEGSDLVGKLAAARKLSTGEAILDSLIIDIIW